MKIFYLQKSIFLLFAWVASSFVSIGCLANSQPKIWNLSNENLVFVGREEYLEAIHSFFQRSGRRILALTGEGGFGKSEIAQKYAEEFSGEYDLIWWFDAQQDLTSQFEKLAIALNTLLPEKEEIIPAKMSKDALVDTIKNILRLKPITYLFIFDNAEEYSQLEKFIPYAHQKFRKNVLLTSRNANIWMDTLEIAKFKRPESIQLIEETLPQDKLVGVEKLAETLGDYPLGLTTAVGFIKTHQTTDISKYITMHLKNTLTNKEQKISPLLNSYPENAYTTLSISLKHIERDSKDALESLLFMSLLNSNDIPETYIEVWLKKTNSTLTADEAIKYICDQSLIKVNKKDARNQMYYLSIHDINHQLINESISKKDKEKLLATAIDVMLDVFSGSSETFIKKIINEPIHLLHAQKICEHAKKIGYTSSKLLQLKVCVFECLMGPLRDFEAAKVLLEDIEKDLKDGVEIASYYRALFNINKGYFKCVYDLNYNEAIHYMNEALALLSSINDYNEEKLRATTNIIQYYLLTGKMNIAKNIIDQGKEIFKLSTSGSYNSLFFFAWSIFLNDQARYEESLEVLQKTKAYPTLATDYPTINHSILHQQIETLIKKGHLKEATEILRECELKIKEFFQGRKNSTLANILVFKGLLLIQSNKSMSAAIQHISEAVEIYKELFHGDKKHRNQGRAYLVLGKAHGLNKDYIKALKAYLFSEEIYNTVLQEKKIDDVSDLYTELAILGTHLKDEGLTQKYLNTHIEIFGLDHPRTEKILREIDQSDLVGSN